MEIKVEPFWHDNEKLLVAVSGGVDSMVLLHVLAVMPNRPFIVVAHVNHHMRSDSWQDGEIVKAACQKYDIPFETNADVPHLKNENDARAYRYRFFQKIVQKYDCQYVVTAHHLDDQIETILMTIHFVYHLIIFI